VDGTSLLWHAASSVVYTLRSKKELKIDNIIEHGNNNKVIKELKQRASANTHRFSRYRKKQNPYYQNKMFRTDCKKFYKLLRQENTSVKKAPTKEEIENFWKELFGKKPQHNEEAYSIKNQCQPNLSVAWSSTSETKVAELL